MKINSFVLLFALFVSAALSQQCVQDYECGNVPYTNCEGGINECSATLPGVAIHSSFLYFAQICRTNDQLLSNITFKKVSVNGGDPTSIYTVVQFPAPGNPSTILEAQGDYLFYSARTYGPGQSFYALNLSDLTQKLIDSAGYFQGILELDNSSNRSFVVNYVTTPDDIANYYEIRRFDGILGQAESFNNYSLYYAPLPYSLSGVRVDGTNLYFSLIFTNFTYSITSFYQGTTECMNCSYLNATHLFDVEEIVLDFDYFGNNIYYGTSEEFVKSNMNGTERVAIDVAATGVRYFSNYIYYNTGITIKRYGVNIEDILKYEGNCGCQPGFSGDKCSTCNNGQIQWSEFGRPFCVPLGQDGNPISCRYSYQCKYYPYSFCFQTCQCHAWLTGTQYKQCVNSSQTIQWEFGFPVCK